MREVQRWWRRPSQLSLHTKVTLSTTAWLIGAGRRASGSSSEATPSAGCPPGSQVLASLFQSVTARTAGFNTVDLAEFTPAGLFILMLLMFVGGSPGSCAGGIKSTTVGVLALAAWQRIRGRSHVNAFAGAWDAPPWRTPSPSPSGESSSPSREASVCSSSRRPTRPSTSSTASSPRYFFEVVSAVGTVGLSVGKTASLTPTARLLVIVLMFLGRLGPLTVATALARSSGGTDFRLAEEDVMVG